MQEEVEEARRRQTEAQEALMSATTEAMRHNRMHNVFETVNTHERYVGEADEHEHEHEHDHISTNGDDNSKFSFYSNLKY